MVIFHYFLKLANVIPVFKKDQYRLTSILKNISKVNERILFKHIGTFVDNFFSKFQCGFRESYLFSYVNWKWKSAVDIYKPLGVLLTDLWLSSTRITNNKIHSYGFCLNALRLIHTYLSKRRQRIKINKSYSSGKKIIWSTSKIYVSTSLFQYLYV